MQILKTQNNIYCNCYEVANTDFTIIDVTYNDTLNYCFIKNDIITVAQFKINEYNEMYDLQIFDDDMRTSIHKIIKMYLHNYYEG